jgi:hypothetical protein
VIPRYFKDKKRLSLPKEQYAPGELAAYGDKLRI